MKSILCAAVFSLLFSLSGVGQTISGKITGIEGEAGAYFEVIVFYLKSGEKAMARANEIGEYSVTVTEQDSLLMKVFEYGVEVFKEELNITGDLTKDINIQPDNMLEGMDVVTAKKLIENKVDRVVYNVEASVMSNGLNLFEVLGMTPLVIASEDAIALAGKSNVAVMIDDKMTNLSGAELVNYLKSLRADDIAKIEVITSPPANYEAEGNSGIINIVLKENPNHGFNGSASGTYIQASYPGYSSNASFNYRSKKIATSLRLRQYDRSIKATENIDIIGDNSIYSRDVRKDSYAGMGLNYSIDYKVNDKVNVGVIYDLSKLEDNLVIDNASTYQGVWGTDSIILTHSDQYKPAISQTLNAYTDIKLDTNGSELNIVANYFSNKLDNNVNFESNSQPFAVQNIVNNTSDIDYDIYSAQADLYIPRKWGELETGGKYTFFSNVSDVQYLNQEGGTYILDSSKSNIFDYQEHNIAGYISYAKELSAKWQLKTGLRYEHSLISGHSITTGETNTNEYGNLFPTFYLAHIPNQSNYITFSYSKRINRPSFSQLNPFKWYSNPYTFYTGNPSLQPSYNHNFEFNYTIKGNYTFGLYAQKLINGAGRTVEVNAQNEKAVGFGNFLEKFDVGINGSAYLALTKWWENYISFNVSYSESSSTLPEILPQNGYAAYYSTNNTFLIIPNKGVKGLINFWHALPSTSGNSRNEDISALAVGVRFPAWKDRLQVNIIYNDILRGTVSKGEIYFSGFTQYYNNYYDSQSFSFSLTYNFGSNTVRGNNKRIQFEDQYRGN